MRVFVENDELREAIRGDYARESGSNASSGEARTPAGGLRGVKDLDGAGRAIMRGSAGLSEKSSLNLKGESQKS